MGHLYQLRRHGRIHEAVGRCPEAYVQSVCWMDRELCCIQQVREGLLKTYFLRSSGTSRLKIPLVFVNWKSNGRTAFSFRLTIIHSSTSLGPTTRPSNLDISPRIQLPTMIPMSASHI